MPHEDCPRLPSARHHPWRLCSAVFRRHFCHRPAWCGRSPRQRTQRGTCPPCCRPLPTSAGQ
nr:MAG TPA: hypothetical protein [Caudoviricetes sp.]